MFRIMIAALVLTSATACSSALPTAPEPVKAVTLVPTTAATVTNNRNINVDPNMGMIPCDWATVPVCGRGAFAACVQHGTGTGQPGPIANWEWSEWQCFPDAYLPH